MKTSTLIRTTALVAAIAGFAGSALADGPFYRTKKDGGGNWSSTSVWQQSTSSSGPWNAASRVPGTGDYITISNGDILTVDANEDATRLTIGDSAQVIATHTLTMHGDGSTSILTVDVVGFGTLEISGGAVVLSGTTPLMTVESDGVLAFSGTNPAFTVNSSGLVDVLSGSAVTVTSTAAALTISSGSSFIVESGASVSVGGAAPSLTVTGDLSLYGDMLVDATSGTPFLDIESSQAIPDSGGSIEALVATTGNAPEIRIASGVTMTNAGTISGQAKIKGASANVGTFSNHGTVAANVAAELLIDSSLNAISDNSSAVWSAGTSSSAVLRINEASNSLSGSFQLLHSGSTVRFGASVGTPSLVVNQGNITVDFNQAFSFGTVTGTCGSKPASNGSLTAGTYGYCN